jgi:hypothetical protein
METERVRRVYIGVGRKGDGNGALGYWESTGGWRRAGILERARGTGHLRKEAPAPSTRSLTTSDLPRAAMGIALNQEGTGQLSSRRCGESMERKLRLQ